MSTKLQQAMQQYEGTTEDQLLNVALHNSSLQQEALDFLESEQHIVQFIQKSINHRINAKLVRKLITQSALMQILTDTLSTEAQIVATMRITDDDFLKTIALSSKYPFDVRFEAVEAIHNPKNLHFLALSLDDKTLRKIAVKKVRDDSVYEQILQNDSDRKIRELAISRIQQPNENLLLQVVLTDPNYYVKEAAVDRIFDPKLLKTIALKCSIADIQRLAIYKLNSVDDLLELRLVVPTALQHEIQKKITKLQS